MARKISEEKEEKLCLIINKIYMKIYNNDYYIDEENREVRSIIGRRTSKMEIYFRNEMAKIYDIVANKVYEEYERKSNKDVIELKSVDFNSENYKQFYAEENADTAYTIIYADGSVSNDFGVNVEPRHTHTTVEVVISEHKKLSDGSCKTTYYEGLKCTVCGTVWKGDVINVVTQQKCTH